MPQWFLEGDAVGIETALTRGGRGRLPLFERDLRTLLLSGKSWGYDKAHLGSYDDYVPDHYVYGYFFTSWLRNQYGDLFLSDVANKSASSSWNPLSFYNAAKKLTGHKFEKSYADIIQDLTSEWRVRADKISPTPYSIKNKDQEFGWTNYYYPQSTSDGRIVALKKGLSFISQFVVLEGDKEEVLFYPGSLQNEYPYKLRGERLAFFELELDPRWGYRDYSRLKVYDLNKKEFVVDKRKLKGRLAIPDHEGNKIAYIEWSDSQGQFIVVLDREGNETLRVPHPTDQIITSIDWLNENEVVVVVKDDSDLKSILKVNLTSGEAVELLTKRLTNIGFLAVEDGSIFFESPESGIDNIYSLSTEGPRQLTSSLFGSYSPEIKDKKLLYNDYTVKGVNVVEKNLEWDEMQNSSDSFYPIYEKFAKSENLEGFESELIKKDHLEILDYSQLKNAINLHSWLILAPPLSPTVSLVGFSRDVLNKFSLLGGSEYNLNEQIFQFFAGATWSHLYPVFDMRAAYGSRYQLLFSPDNDTENRWDEGTFEAGVSIPWKYIQGRFTHKFSSRVFSKLIQVNDKLTLDKSEVSHGTLHSPGLEFSYSVVQRFAHRDINPRWGVVFNGRAEKGKNITGERQEGSLQSAESRVYLPGLKYHHSFFHQIAYERQKDNFYQYSSQVLYPRGTRSFFLQEFTKYSGNYLMPLYYPDFNLSRYVYFKRLSLNLFYDELNGRYGSFHYRAASAGWETVFELNLLRLVVPISFGLRGSYILDGKEKDDNYEIFLTSVLGTF